MEASEIVENKRTETNITALELDKGIERQLRKLTCKNYYHYTLVKKLNKLDKTVHPLIETNCECDYCTGKQESKLIKYSDWW